MASQDKAGALTRSHKHQETNSAEWFRHSRAVLGGLLSRVEGLRFRVAN